LSLDKSCGVLRALLLHCNLLAAATQHIVGKTSEIRGIRIDSANAVISRREGLPAQSLHRRVVRDQALAGQALSDQALSKEAFGCRSRCRISPFSASASTSPKQAARSRRGSNGPGIVKAPGLVGLKNRAAHNKADRQPAGPSDFRFFRRRQCDAHQFPANAEILVRRANRQRAKQISGGGAGKTGVIRTDAMVSPRSEATKESRRSCGPCSRTRSAAADKPPRAECFFVDKIDGRVMRRVFGEKDKIVAGHGKHPDKDDKTWGNARLGACGLVQRRRKAVAGIRKSSSDSAFSKAGLHRPMQNAPFTVIFFAFLLFRLMSWAKEIAHGNAG
jgi:hypothetical protein